MTQETRVAVREDKAVVIYELETRFELAVRQRSLLEDYIKKRLQPDKHFYTVSDGQKPSLTKEGAELICLPHALKGHYQWLSGPDNPPLDETPYQITMKCELEANGKFAGEGVGSASSMVTKKDGTRVQRQKDPGLRHNATIKMACKSAYIAATLNSTAASEFFTQDLEDDQAGDNKKPVNTKEHWCAEHKTAFFMKGKMKAYAHPIGDSGVWCHEHTGEKQPDKTTGEIKEPVPQDDQEFENLKPAPDPEPPKPNIDIAWVREQIAASHWGLAELSQWLCDKFQIPKAKTARELWTSIEGMSVEQAKLFANELNDRVKMAGK